MAESASLIFTLTTCISAIVLWHLLSLTSGKNRGSMLRTSLRLLHRCSDFVAAAAVAAYTGPVHFDVKKKTLDLFGSLPYQLN